MLFMLLHKQHKFWCTGKKRLNLKQKWIKSKHQLFDIELKLKIENEHILSIYFYNLEPEF